MSPRGAQDHVPSSDVVGATIAVAGEIYHPSHMPHASRQVRVALLDIDGTLVDSNDPHAHAWVDAFCETGYGMTFDQVRPLVGMGGDKILPKLAGIDADGEEGKRISARRSSIFFERYLPRIQAWPQARALIERMGGVGLRLVIATSAKQDEYESLSRIFGGEA